MGLFEPNIYIINIGPAQMKTRRLRPDFSYFDQRDKY